MIRSEMTEVLEGLDSAEEFLDYFAIDYQPSVVQVNRLHILQRFHDYLEQEETALEQAIDDRDRCRQLLERAYLDFLHSDARSERVFRVFRMGEPQVATVTIDQIGRSGR